jgi:hypothetical protein
MIMSACLRDTAPIMRQSGGMAAALQIEKRFTIRAASGRVKNGRAGPEIA